MLTVAWTNPRFGGPSASPSSARTMTMNIQSTTSATNAGDPVSRGHPPAASVTMGVGGFECRWGLAVATPPYLPLVGRGRGGGWTNLGGLRDPHPVDCAADPPPKGAGGRRPTCLPRHAWPEASIHDFGDKAGDPVSRGHPPAAGVTMGVGGFECRWELAVATPPSLPLVVGRGRGGGWANLGGLRDPHPVGCAADPPHKGAGE
jgi:hypothetical protein